MPADLRDVAEVRHGKASDRDVEIKIDAREALQLDPLALRIPFLPSIFAEEADEHHRMPDSFGICHLANTVYCCGDYKTWSITRTNYCHSIMALCGRGQFACEAHSEMGAEKCGIARGLPRSQ